MSFIKNLFGGKKSGQKKGYFVEFDDSPATNGKSAPKSAETPAQPPAAEADTASQLEPDAVSAPTETVVPISAGKAAKDAISKAKQAQKGEAKEAVTTAEISAAISPQLVEPTVPVKEPESATFAPVHLNPASALNSGRRRPGPSLSPFMDLARQVKAPRK